MNRSDGQAPEYAERVPGGRQRKVDMRFIETELYGACIADLASHGDDRVVNRSLEVRLSEQLADVSTYGIDGMRAVVFAGREASLADFGPVTRGAGR